MLEHIEISNFKSIKNIKLDLGRVNIFIGENGSGKSNILEAIAFLSAYFFDKLDDEFLSSRGMRSTHPSNFKSFFNINNRKNSIIFSFKYLKYEINDIKLNYDSKENWDDLTKKITNLKELVADENNVFKSLLGNRNSRGFIKNIFERERLELELEISNIAKHSNEKAKSEIQSRAHKVIDQLNKLYKRIEKLDKDFLFHDFLIYSPENTCLRNFEDNRQLKPIGIKGEGLFAEVKRIFAKPNKSQIDQILQELQILDWFDSFEIPTNTFPGEKAFNIKDKYLAETTKFFDQRLANEGFLLLLFYFTLLISEKTPKFFAIDNIDSALNPKLCSELIKRMTKISKAKKKQFIATTHNPFILDGLNLEDDAQRLFVVSRNINGETIVNRIQPKQKLTIPLSEAWMRGYLGGLPNNF
jgi:AAA15 family ATPase/GTPase